MRLPMPRLHYFVGIACSMLVTGSFAQAQERTPAQQALASARFTIISPFPAGGPTDVLARTLAEGLSARYGQPAVVENLAGAGGNIGMERAKRARGNGHTLLVVPAGNITINPVLMPNFPFNIQRDFTPITMLANTPNVLVVHRDAGIDTVDALIAKAKAQPDSLSYATPGVGSGLHMAGELFKHNAEVDILHVAYRGTGPAINDVMAGVVPMAFSSLFSVMPYMQAGTLKVLATTSALRSPIAPELPTLNELGVPGIDVSSWYGLLGPAGMESELVQQLAQDAAQILAAPDIQARLSNQGMSSRSMSPAEFASSILVETREWEKLIQARRLVAN